MLQKILVHFKNQPLVFASLFLLLLAGIFLHFQSATYIPAGVYHDEQDYVTTGSSIITWGTDISGQWSPWQLKPLNTFNFTSELAAVFHVPFQFIFGTGPDVRHIPSLFFGFATAVTLGWIAYSYTKNRAAGIISAVLFWLTPWQVHLSHLAYESSISLFFQVLGLAFWQRISTQITRSVSAKKSASSQETRWFWLLILGYILSIFFAFFTYHAAKVTVVAIFGFLSILLIAKNRSKIALLIGISTLIWLASLLGYTYLSIQNGNYGERTSEFLSLDELSSGVNDRRRLSMESPLTPLLINKYTQLAYEITSRYFFVFDPKRLFLAGYESGDQFSLMVHGYLYVSTAVFFIIGTAWLWQKDRKLVFLLLIPLLLLSPLATVLVTTPQAVLRSALTYTLLLGIAGIGAWRWFVFVQNKRAYFIATLIVVILELGWFHYLYQVRFSFESLKTSQFSDRVLAGYIQHLPADQKVYVVSFKDPFIEMRSILFYTNTLVEMEQEARAQFADPYQATYAVGNITVSTDCPEAFDPSVVYLTALFAACEPTNKDSLPPRSELASAYDSGTLYFIYNDPVCTDTTLNSYVYTQKLEHFKPEKLSRTTFCSTWTKR